MKKLITLFLILAMLLPSASVAVVGDSPYFGKWVAEEHHVIKHYDTVLHYVYIHENGPCAYMKFNIMHGGSITRPKAEVDTMFDGNWEIVDDHVRLPTSVISYIDLFIDEDGNLYCKDPKLTFVKVP